MLVYADLVAARVIVQLHLVSASAVRTELAALAAEKGDGPDLVNRLAAKLGAKETERVRHRVALFQHVRAEALYVQLLERESAVKRNVLLALIAGLEHTGFRKRLGDLLVKQGRITKEEDEAFAEQLEEATAADDRASVDRARSDAFAIVDLALVPGSKLEPEDFKISSLFRSKETQALVDRVEVRGARAPAGLPAAVPAAVPASKTPVSAASPSASAMPALTPSRAQARTPDARLRGLARVGAYEVTEVLRPGLLGGVVLARRRGAEGAFIVRVLFEDWAGPELERFERETRAAKLVRHPGVLELVDSGSEEGYRFQVARAEEARELRSVIESAGAAGVAAPLALRVFDELLDAVQALHDAGIVHRDLRPETVIVRPGATGVRVLGLGLSVKLGADGRAEAPRGDQQAIHAFPAYLAPETAAGDPLSTHSDVYSLGVILFELLTGARPVQAASATTYRIAHEVAPPLTLAEASNKEWPAALESLVARLLAKSRDGRPASCREVRALCAELGLQGGPAPFEPAAAAQSAERFAARGWLGRLGMKRV